jgi:hypothetical protein
VWTARHTTRVCRSRVCHTCTWTPLGYVTPGARSVSRCACEAAIRHTTHHSRGVNGTAALSGSYMHVIHSQQPCSQQQLCTTRVRHLRVCHTSTYTPSVYMFTTLVHDARGVATRGNSVQPARAAWTTRHTTRARHSWGCHTCMWTSLGYVTRQQPCTYGARIPLDMTGVAATRA